MEDKRMQERSTAVDAIKAGPLGWPAAGETEKEERGRRKEEKKIIRTVIRYGGSKGKEWIEKGCNGLKASEGRLGARIQALMQIAQTWSDGARKLAQAIEAMEETDDKKLTISLKESAKEAKKRKTVLGRDEEALEAVEQLAKVGSTGGRDKGSTGRAETIAATTRLILESKPRAQHSAQSYVAVTKSLGPEGTANWGRQGSRDGDALAEMAGTALMVRAELGYMSPELREVVQLLEGGRRRGSRLEGYAKETERSDAEMGEWIRRGRYPEQEAGAHKELEEEGQRSAIEGLARLMVQDPKQVDQVAVVRTGAECGLRIVGTRGEKARFDARHHKPDHERIPNGETCRVARPGVDRVGPRGESERIIKTIMKRATEDWE